MTITRSVDTQLNIVRQFQELIGSDCVTSGEEIEQERREQLLQAIAPTDIVPCVISPRTQDELSEVVACAFKNRWPMMPIGNGSKLRWGGLAQNVQVFVSTSRLTQLIDHAVGDLTITAEAGIGFQSLTNTLHQANQQLGIDPTYPEQATLGGIVATGDTGSLRQRYGSVRDMLIGISFIRADGTVAKAGGRVVKNVAGYDLMKLMTGAYGTLGIISQLTFRVYPMAETSQTLLLMGEADAIQSLTTKVLASSLTPNRSDLLSPTLVKMLDLGEGMALVLQFQSIGVSVEQQVQQLSTMAAAESIKTVEYLKHESESALWKQLRERMATQHTDVPITCKIGVLPNQAVATLAQLPDLLPVESCAQIHAGSGLGRVFMDGQAIAPQSIIRLRSWCESHGGFLTVLDAPPSWKQQLDIWGYAGNGLSVMQNLKAQFDPYRLLSPACFIDSI